jgi:hypothetical protein
VSRAGLEGVDRADRPEQSCLRCRAIVQVQHGGVRRVAIAAVSNDSCGRHRMIRPRTSGDLLGGR